MFCCLINFKTMTKLLYPVVMSNKKNLLNNVTIKRLVLWVNYKGAWMKDLVHVRRSHMDK